MPPPRNETLRFPSSVEGTRTSAQELKQLARTSSNPGCGISVITTLVEGAV